MAMPRKLVPEKQQAVADEYANGRSLKSLQEEFGVSFSTIRSYVLGHGGVLRNVGRPRKTVEV